jgi:hypothetical protein
MRASTTPLSIDQIRRACPAVFQTNPHPDRSGKYVHISTEPVLQHMLDAGYGVSRAQQTTARNPTRAGYARHLLAFRPAKSFNKKARVGDMVPEVVLLNSHDGNCSYRLHVGMYRLVCANGMIAGNDFASLRIRHMGSPAEQVLEASEEVFEHYVPRLIDWVERATTTKLTQRTQVEFAARAQALRHDPKAFDAKELLRVRRTEDKGNDLWSVYNRVQENLMRGGIEAKTATGRTSVTKPINRITKDVIFNQRLWDAANDVLEAAA